MCPVIQISNRIPFVRTINMQKSYSPLWQYCNILIKFYLDMVYWLERESFYWYQWSYILLNPYSNFETVIIGKTCCIVAKIIFWFLKSFKEERSVTARDLNITVEELIWIISVVCGWGYYVSTGWRLIYRN